MSVDAHTAGGYVVEAGQQVGDGGLAGAGGAHQGDGLAGRGTQAHVAQYRVFMPVGEADVIEGDVPFHQRQLRGVRGIGDGRLGVQQGEDALRASEGCLQLREEVGDPLEGLEEPAHVEHEGDDRPH